MTIKTRKRLYKEVDTTFFLHDKLWESSRVDGKTREDLVEVTCSDSDFFIETTAEEVVCCITSCKALGEDIAEVHTFVLPRYRKISDVILRSHVLTLEKLGYKKLYTACSSRNKSVKRFLERRLGFETYGEFTSANLKVDGEMPTIYNLVRITKEKIDE